MFAPASLVDTLLFRLVPLFAFAKSYVCTTHLQTLALPLELHQCLATFRLLLQSGQLFPLKFWFYDLLCYALESMWCSIRILLNALHSCIPQLNC